MYPETNESPLRQAEVIMALSLATDLGTGMAMESVLRSCLLSVRLGDALGFGTEDLSDIYYLSLLCMIGCTAESHQTADIFGDELALNDTVWGVDFGKPRQAMGWLMRSVGVGKPPLQRFSLLAGVQKTMKQSRRGHCDVAQHLAERMGFSSRVQAALWHIYERWDGRGMPYGLKGEALALPVRVAQIAMTSVMIYGLAGPEAAVAVVRERAGTAFDPAMSERFCEVGPQLLSDFDKVPVWEAVLAAEPGPRRHLTSDQLLTMCETLADFVDLKSFYTVGHSRGVADLASRAARQCGMSQAEATTLRQAGLIHDLGRVGVQSGIWDKEGPLLDSEWERVRLHPYYTERIVARPKALAQLGALAALHHERLDGSGYFRALPASGLSPAARILAAADVYHAMTEPRPHRVPLEPEAAASALKQEVRDGRIDSDAANAVLAAAGHRVQAVRHERVARLTEREIEVLRLVARGHSNRVIAGALGLTPKTVGNHIQNIYSKIDVSTRAGATVFAMQHGIV